MTDIDKLWRVLSAAGGYLSVTTFAVGVSVVLLAMLVIVAVRARRGVRGASRNAKLAIGTAVVQAGVTWVVVTGTYAFCRTVFHLPAWEAVAFAVFLEAATWVAVGMIYAHAKDQKTGFGPAGPFFWLFSLLGGLLAIIAGRTHGEMTGRAVVVVFGSCLWYLQLLRVTLRPATPGRLRWTPRRLLVAIGAIEPGDHDVADENREWQIRRLARAMRWANSRWRPVAWAGQRSLIRRGETAQEDVIRDARRRFAVAYLMTTSVAPDSPVMRRVLAAVEAGHVPGQSDSRTADKVDGRTAGTQDAPDSPDIAGRVPAPATNGHLPVVADRTVVDMSARRHGGGQGRSADTVSVEVLADTLGKAFKDERVGRPKALAELRRVYGSCSMDRAIAAKDLHNARRESTTPGSGDSDADDKEREAVVAS